MRDMLFYLVGAGILVLATVTVTVRNLFHAALALLGTLFGSAILFLLLGAEMVALAQVLVYIGGIMVFVLYAVFLTSDLGSQMPAPSGIKKLLGFSVAAAMFALLGGLIWKYGSQFSQVNAQAGYASLHALGIRMLHPGPHGFLIPFELVSILLLAAMVGALAVARGIESKEKP